MRRVGTLVVSVVVGCGGQVGREGEVAAEPADPGLHDGALRAQLVLTASTQEPYWGDQVAFTVVGAAPDETVQLLWSGAGVGPGPCSPIIGGQCLGLLAPVRSVGSAVTDAGGVATFTFDLPWPGPVPARSLGLQAVVVRGIDGVDSLLSAPLATEVSTDPGDGTPVQDSFTWQGPKLDVLFVVDDSCSMAEEQVALASSLPGMVGFFQSVKADFHIGIVTTDMLARDGGGQLVEVDGYRWIDRNTANPADVFAAMVTRGTSGHYEESGLDAVHAAVEVHGGGHNAGFFRPDAQLSTFVLSDENDDSVNVDPATFSPWYERLRAGASDTTFHSIVDVNGCAQNIGWRYLDVTHAVGGIEYSICDGSYAYALEAATDWWWTSRPLVLSQTPRPGTIEVTAQVPNGTPTLLGPDEWVFEPRDNSVRTRLPVTPVPGTVFWVSYLD